MCFIPGVISQAHDKQRSDTQNPGGLGLLYRMDYLPTVWLEQVIRWMEFQFEISNGTS